MKTSPKCIGCFFRQIEATSCLLKLSRIKRGKLQLSLTKRLLEFDFNQPPVAFGRTIYKTISRASGIKDIFGKEKIRIEKFLLSYYDYLEGLLKNMKDRLYGAAKLSCIANAIDFGAGKPPDLKRLVSEIKSIKLKVNDFRIFKQKLNKAKTVLFVGDNCGEALFDRIFMEQILAYNSQVKIFYATRSAPIINDVLVGDARRMGIDRVAKVISSGCDYPGLVLSKTSKYFKRIYRSADFIISKGQGNFESFEGKKDIFYLFKIKCPAVSDFLSLSDGSLLFLYNRPTPATS